MIYIHTDPQTARNQTDQSGDGTEIRKRNCVWRTEIPSLAETALTPATSNCTCWQKLRCRGDMKGLRDRARYYGNGYDAREQ